MKEKYYLGLDMGTSSVGWAVTGTDYRLLRAKGKDLWGVRLFPEAQTSASRRSYRTSRRRLQREKAKVAYLRSVFEEEINKIDPGFYQRLDDSKYFPEDKTEKQKFTLFAGQDYNDKDFYREYPTIFHLRKALIESDAPKDVRLVFLAILNIFKHRGHFLNENLSGEEMTSLKDLYDSLVEVTENFPDVSDVLYIEEILSSNKISNSSRAEQLMKLFGLNKKMQEAEMIKLLCGLKGQLSKAFPDDTFDQEYVKYSISFRDGNYDEKEAEVFEILSDDSIEIFRLLKQMHDYGLLSNITQGERFLSFVRVKTYEKHAYDLDILQAVYKKYAKASYNEMFRIMEDNNYSSYVGSVNSDKEVGKRRRGAKCKQEEFFKRLKKELGEMKKEHPEDDDLTYILEEIEKETFLPKQLTSSNGVIPYQVHLAELKAILANAEKYLPFLKETDETGLSISERIISLFSFRIPYYIGPLYNDGKHNAWVSRREAGKVFPWNFEQKIDVKASSEAFIQRMVKQCTYLCQETVLPKSSLLYEKYMVLNELNNLKINDIRIDVELKQKIFEELFRVEKKVTMKKLVSYLQRIGVIGKGEETIITGIDGDFKNNLANYHKFQEIFDTEILTYEQEKIAEQIIQWSTVYGDSRSFLKEKIEEVYGKTLKPEQIKRILGIRFRDWGRLSREFLQLEGADRDTGEIKTIISRMWDENYNLMELLSGNFTYLDEIRERGSVIEKTFTDIEYEDLDDFNLSVPVKRMVWQTILVVREITKILGSAPERIFVEMARDENAKNEKKRTISRKKKFLDLYKACKSESRDWIKEIGETEEKKFRSKKLYLYYTQKGKCMYSGDPIELEDLFNDNLYDIDHIYPRHFVKDDSIENNLVLVKKQLNNHKSDRFPIESEIRQKQYSMWKSLVDAKFITKEKFERLIRNTTFEPEERAAFINRQIVETRQGTKTVTRIFEHSFPDSKVIYTKAGNVSDFRYKFDLLKCREINNLHHAQDAYLNIVVGNVYYTKFTGNPMNFLKEAMRNPEDYKYHMDKIFDYPVSRGNVDAWITKADTSIRTVKRMLDKQSPLVTRMNYEVHGKIADQTIYSASDAVKVQGKNYISIKESDEKISDVCKYGGFTNYSGAYFFLVEHSYKKKRIRTLEAMPLYLKDKLSTVEKMEKYCIDTLSLKDPQIRMKRIKMYSLIKVDGFELFLTGRSANQLTVLNATEMKLDYESIKYIKKISSFDAYDDEDSNFDETTIISRSKNIQLYDLLTDKYNHSVLKKRPNAIGEKLKNGKKKFENLTIAKQIYVLKQILLCNFTNGGVDLQLIGESKTTGSTKLNKKISDHYEFKLISISPAGIYRKETDLLTV